MVTISTFVAIELKVFEHLEVVFLHIDYFSNKFNSMSGYRNIDKHIRTLFITACSWCATFIPLL